jgi:hypothetical protein
MATPLLWLKNLPTIDFLPKPLMALLDKLLFRNDSKRSDKKLWSESTEFDSAWKTRIGTMASYIDVPGTVADFGCGMMWLEQFLGAKNTYLPIDYIRRDERTIVLDFNRDPLPTLEAEVAFLSGCLEYVHDVPAFLRELTSRKFKQIILSYCTIETWSNRRTRRELNWVSDESIFRILSAFLPNYCLTQIGDISGNILLSFKLQS